MEQFEAADALATLVGQHGSLKEAKIHAEQAHAKCSIAHMALEQASSTTWLSNDC